MNEKESRYIMWKCPDCGFEGEPRVETTTENTDRDGNRGIEITWIICPICEYEEGIR